MRGVVRLRNVETRAEMDLSRKEVAAVILQRGTSSSSLSLSSSYGSDEGGPPPSPNPNPPQNPNAHSHTLPIVFSNVEIVVLHDETRGRANRKIIIQAQQDMSRVLRALSPNTLAKVACVDLPIQVLIIILFVITFVSPFFLLFVLSLL